MREIAGVLNGYTVVVTKSTVPVGTGDEIARIVADMRPDAEVAVVSNPEFLREGAGIPDFMQPDRIVVGTEDERARELMRELYAPLTEKGAPLIFTERRGAEVIKYAANAFLATKITFINEIADLCEQAGADVLEVAHGIGLDHRIGPKFLNPGPGYGGSCFPKDLLALLKAGIDFGTPIRSIETIIAINDQRKRAMARKIIAACGGSIRGSTVAVLGLTFKPDTDDMRESPALTIIAALQDAGAKVRAYDPQGMEHAKSVLNGVEFAERCLCVCERCGSAGDHDGVERVPVARPRARQEGAGSPGRRRPAQHLPAGRHGEGRLHLRQHRPARGRTRPSQMKDRPDPRHLPVGHPPVRSGRIGVLLLNLGTPDGTDYWSMRRYLKEFLSDRRVIEEPRLKWWLILNLIILTVRPGRKGRDYEKIWNKERNEGPLKTITRSQAEKLAPRWRMSGSSSTGRCATPIQPSPTASRICSAKAATVSCWCLSIHSMPPPRRQPPATRPSVS